MSAGLRGATIAWCVAIAGAAGGVVAAKSNAPLAIALFAVAIVLGLGVAVVLVRTMRRDPRRRPDPPSPLRRLDHLPSVTSRAPLLRWRGSRYWSIGRRGRLPGALEDERELVGSRAAPATDPAGRGGVDAGAPGGIQGAPAPDDEASPGR